MKILATMTLLLALAVSALGYVDYQQSQDMSLLHQQMSALTQEVHTQHQSLVSHKKAILILRSNQKQSDRAVLAILLFLTAQESSPSPKTESNAYAQGN